MDLECARCCRSFDCCWAATHSVFMRSPSRAPDRALPPLFPGVRFCWLSCVSAKRILVHESVFDEFVGKLVKKVWWCFAGCNVCVSRASSPASYDRRVVSFSSHPDPLPPRARPTPRRTLLPPVPSLSLNSVSCMPKVDGLRLADPMDLDAHMGPVVHANALKAVSGIGN